MAEDDFDKAFEGHDDDEDETEEAAEDAEFESDDDDEEEGSRRHGPGGGSRRAAPHQARPDERGRVAQLLVHARRTAASRALRRRTATTHQPRASRVAQRRPQAGQLFSCSAADGDKGGRRLQMTMAVKQNIRQRVRFYLMRLQTRNGRVR